MSQPVLSHDADYVDGSHDGDCTDAFPCSGVYVII